MKVLILGVDGYLGWSLATHLVKFGHQVAGVDAYYRRDWVAEMGSHSAVPIARMTDRLACFAAVYDKPLIYYRGDITNYDFILNVMKAVKPDAVVHLAEMPSAPYSMIDASHAAWTHTNNLNGTLNVLHAMRDVCPESHLVKLGTMGEYGTPDIDIPEGEFWCKFRGRSAYVTFPRDPGSWYHCCYDDETEILTENGWRKMKNLTKEVRVATLAKDRKTLEFDFPEEIVSYDYAGDMDLIETERLNIKVTSGHNMLVGNKRRVRGLNWKIRKIEEVTRLKNAIYKTGVENWRGRDQRWFVFPKVEIPVKALRDELGRYSGEFKWGKLPEKKVPMESWLDFLGWFITDGTLKKPREGGENPSTIIISQLKEKNFKYIERVLKELGVEFDPVVVNGKKAGFRTNDPWLKQYLWGMDKHRIPHEFLDLNPKYLERLFKSLIRGDGFGDVNEVCTFYSCISKGLADDVQELCLKTGRSATVVEYRSGEYRVNILKKLSTQAITTNLRQSGEIYRKERYVGKVYCCQVANDIILVRRQGKVAWCGNTKVHDSVNVKLACRMWGLRSTDIMQGVVYGTFHDEAVDLYPDLRTRFDFDQCFGTAINRFCAQAVINEPITPFGKGHQKRGFLPLKDSMQCLTLAIEKPPIYGEYRTLNQFEEVYDLTALAMIVRHQARGLGMDSQVLALENPRMELDEHYYNPDHEKLLKLGYKPTCAVDEEVRIMLLDLVKFRGRIYEKKFVLMPDIKWSGVREQCQYL